MGQQGSSSRGEREIVVELTMRRLLILILLAILAVIIAYAGFELFSAQYGSGRLIIDFSLDKESYRPGEEVAVRVSVSSGVLGSLVKMPAGGVPVAIEVRNPAGSVVYVDQGETGSDGTLVFRFKILKDGGAGEYVFYLACTGGNRSGRVRVEP